MERPPADQPKTLDIGPIKGMPIVRESDPLWLEERAAWSRACRIAQALHSVDELLDGMADADWRVRHETVDRLIARAGDDPRTLPALLRAVTDDEASEVRDAVAMSLLKFTADAVEPSLRIAAQDPVEAVRWAAKYALWQLGLGLDPGDFYCS